MRRKKLLVTLASALAAIVLLVCLLPTLLSGYARGVVVREMEARVDGTVALESLTLGWLSSQRLEGLVIDGGAERGSVAVSAEVSEGLFALLRGEGVTVSLTGSATTAFDAEGRLGLARLLKPVPVSDAPAVDEASSITSAGQGPLGARTVTVVLHEVGITATGPNGAAYALSNLEGQIALGGNTLRVALDAATSAVGREGALSIDADLALAFTPTNALDLARSAGTVLIDASRISWPSAAGEIACSALRIDAAKAAEGPTQGDLAVKADIVARVAGSSEATIKADFTVGAPFDAAGQFILEPADISASIEARGVPMGALQPLVPASLLGAEGAAQIDLVKDIGETADLTVVKQKGDRARIALNSRQIQFTFDGAVASDGSSVVGGSITARATVRPELLAALGGLQEATALEVAVRGEKIAWQRAGDDAVRSFSGAYELELVKPIEFRTAFDEVRIRAQTLKASLSKELGEKTAHASLSTTAHYGVAGDASLSAAGEVELASFALTKAAIDATATLDSGFLERVSHGAVAARGAGASVKLSVPEFAYLPSDEYQGLRAVLGRAQLELSGALAVEGAGTTAAVNDLRVDLAMPRNGKPGSLALGAKVDGAALQVTQQFGPIPAGELTLPALALAGTVAIDELDPSFLGRLIPAAQPSIGLLGHGAMSLSLRNRSERSTVLADFALDAVAIDASGSLSYKTDALAASNLVIDATLTAEALASLDFGPDTELEPGTKISLRAPMFALALQGETVGSDGQRVAGVWRPSGDLAMRAVVEGLRVRRAPGIVAPLGLAKLDASIGYAFSEERATMNGNATLGGGGSAGDLAFGLAWKKPTAASLFSGVEGTLALTNFDLARFEPSFGLTVGTYSGILGGLGALRLEFNEREVPNGTVTLEFPKTRGSLALRAPQLEATRVAQLKGALRCEIAPAVLAKLAGLADDPSRRVLEAASVQLDIANASVPLNAEMKPQLADGMIDATGTLTPISIEIVGAAGARTVLSTGALALTLRTAKLSDDLALRVTGSEATGANAALEVDLHVKGAVAAKPTVDATIRATRFPAATLDALLSSNGAVGRSLGDALDAQITARGLSSDGGTLAIKLSSAFASLDAPALTVIDGAIVVTTEAPATATFLMSPSVREQLLASINPVFSDVSTGAPAKFALASLSWPLDGDRRKFNASFTLETGEVKLVNSGVLTGLLTLVNAGRSDGFEAYLDPLRGTVKAGRLTYSDFLLRAGKTAQGSWRNSLVFAGDIDLASTPMRAIAITTSLPLSDAANWSKDARGVVDALNAASPELVKSLTVGVELSGPLFDRAGKPVKLASKLKLPDLGEVLRENPGSILDAAGGIFDAIRNRKKTP